MKLDVQCMQCQQEKGFDNRETMEVELNNSGLLEATCSCGHKNIVLLQNPKYELLFDLGAMALSDGYTREAVSSIAASLERFYEFFIHVIFIHNKISETTFTNYWKTIAKQSERQFGSFYTLYVSIFSDLPPSLSNSQIEFRNDVIHNGYLATETEVLKYGQKVGDIIQSLSRKLIDFDQEAFGNEIFARYQSIIESKDLKKVQISYEWINTLFSTTFTDFAKEPFDLKSKVEELKKSSISIYTERRIKFHKDFNLKTLREYLRMTGQSLPYQYEE